MDSVFESYLGADGMLANVAGAVADREPDDIPKVNTNVWILGKCYNAIQELDLIRRDVQSRLYCSYRRGFVPLGDMQLTTDKGWGCMLRCGQMVLAQALIDLHLGREWFWQKETRDATYLKIVQRFEDARKSYFSIHQIALMGNSEDKKVGQWFGPNTIAQVLKKLVRYDDWCSLVIHVAMDNSIVINDILSLCLENANNDDSWKPLLLIIPLRLGLNDINPIYIPALKRCFELLGNCGMMGGRPNQALYFIGYVDDEVLYLDPHTTQRSGSVGEKTTADESSFDETFHQKYAGRLLFQNLDPSLAVCFLCKTRFSFDVLLNQLRTQVLSASMQPLFEICETRSLEWIPQQLSTTGTTIANRQQITNRFTTMSAITTTTAPSSAALHRSDFDLDSNNTTPFEITSMHEFSYPCSRRNNSCCDSEDFENVNHVRTTDAEDSDEDFEIIT